MLTMKSEPKKNTAPSCNRKKNKKKEEKEKRKRAKKAVVTKPTGLAANHLVR